MRIADCGLRNAGRNQNFGKILGLTIAKFIPQSAFRISHSAFLVAYFPDRVH
jgi:hypothetical protein